MKIICVGWNYGAHNTEMGRSEVHKPSVFMKPDTALLRENKPFFIPSFSDRVEYETELVVKINRLGKNIAERFAHRYYDEITVGVDFTARDLQQQEREAGEPWEISKAFDHSAVVGKFVSIDSLPDTKSIQFSLLTNGVEVQHGVS